MYSPCMACVILYLMELLYPVLYVLASLDHQNITGLTGITPTSVFMYMHVHGYMSTLPFPLSSQNLTVLTAHF